MPGTKTANIETAIPSLKLPDEPHCPGQMVRKVLFFLQTCSDFVWPWRKKKKKRK